MRGRAGCAGVRGRAGCAGVRGRAVCAGVRGRAVCAGVRGRAVKCLLDVGCSELDISWIPYVRGSLFGLDA